jgi:hypothetical protein
MQWSSPLTARLQLQKSRDFSIIFITRGGEWTKVGVRVGVKVGVRVGVGVQGGGAAQHQVLNDSLHCSIDY